MSGSGGDSNGGGDHTEGHLPAGVSLEDLVEAVRSSGYPLQGRVADAVGELVGAPMAAAIHEEWRYVDAESGRSRAIDVRCEIFPETTADLERVRPFVDLLIECKSSELPWLFFTRPGSGHTVALPRIAGLPSEELRISDHKGGSWRLPAVQACGLIAEPFVLDAAPSAGSFARVRRKGKKLELSGTEGWESLTSPLLKAVDYLCEVTAPPATLRAFDARLVLPIAVLDAPMYQIGSDASGSPQIEPISWVRVERHETPIPGSHPTRPRLSSFDVIQVDALSTYVPEVLSFGDQFVRAVRRHQHSLADGHGFVPSMADGFDHSQLRGLSELEPSVRARMRAAGLGTFAASFVRPPMRGWRHMRQWSAPGPR